ncbi:hypothetical protein V5P93_004092 [Actinokineospora auranticolor]|uniref:Arabinofuranosyltransferase n=1 Tax=Actinokineospora auranticolor TaxID=155976 RepID=A0A2S6GD27_9PSEU|nr:hypothetical protein [Actinokineospora auranticolor]PPK63157.1 arabinofuranosyltransferase [Actinokineospora auranticolor]
MPSTLGVRGSATERTDNYGLGTMVLTAVKAERTRLIDRRTPRDWWNLAAIALVVVVFAAVAWHRRWICDDGLIVLRTVRNILEGNGPVYNVGERVESNTSVLWTYVLVVAGLIPGVRLEWASVVLGGLFAAGGVLLGLQGARLLHPSRLIVPAGALVVLGMSPYWDYATSGLESGLCVLWLAGTWWLLVRHATGAMTAVWPTLVVIGVGTLVRPEYALVSAIAFAALVAIRRPGWRAGLLWVAITGALPVAYQIFRMGYYGLLTPNTALAKEGGKARWEMGGYYLDDFVSSYQLWIPLLLLVVVAALVFRRMPRPTVIAVGAIAVSGLALALYVTRVGGDYMHARMLLPALFCLLLPLMVVPLTKWLAVPVLGLAVWAGVAAASLRSDTVFTHKIGAHSITDARVFWLDTTHKANPVVAEDAEDVPGYLQDIAAARAGKTGPVLVIKIGANWVALPAKSTVVTSPGALGFPGLLLPSDLKVTDDLGLANPLASHTVSIPGYPMGHDKLLTPPWSIADVCVGTPEELSALTGGAIPAHEIAAARVALQRPEIRQMLDSVREPMTAGRFLSNIANSFENTSLRYGRDPVAVSEGR